MASTLEIRLFGHPEVRLGGQPLDSKLPHKALALLYYLALAEQPVGRETLATLLWPDAPPPTAKHSLRNLLSLLHKALGDVLALNQRTIALAATYVQHIDVVAFQQGLAAIQHAQQRGAAPDLARWQATLDLYRGEFLAGFYIQQSEPFEEWTTLRREYLRQQLITHLLALSTAYADNAADTAALTCLDRLLTIEPTNEAAYMRQIQLLLAAGRRTEARQRYERYRQILADEFDLSPAPALRALLTEAPTQAGGRASLTHQGEATPQTGATRGHRRLPALPSAPHPLVRPSPPTNLARPLSVFVGRNQEIDYLCQRLTDQTCRLLTIVGPGGMGKTSLAHAAGQRLWQAHATAFPDGIYFVALAGLDPDKNAAENEGQAGALMATTIAERIGCDLQSGLPVQIQLQNYLRKRQLLLILDNFEQLLAATDTVLALLTQAPTLTLLITSRARLNVRGETVLTLGKLSLPTDAALLVAQAAGALASPAALAQTSEAVAMFVQRAQCLDPHFSLNATNLDPVLRICHLVDGLPLGIELVTSMLPLLSCTDLAQELAQDLAFLQAATRDLPADQRTLGAVFERSWRLLTAPEQALLTKLAIFPATFHAAAAQAIAAASPPLLLRLINQSLVNTTPDGRYTIHRSVRAFALDKLAQMPAQGAALRVQYAHFYLDFLAQKEPALKGSGLMAVTTQIYSELDNIRLAWRWAITYELHSVLLAALHALFHFYELQGLFSEAVEQAESALQPLLGRGTMQEQPDEPAMNLLIGRLQTYFAVFTMRLGRTAQADAAYSASLARLQHADSPFATVVCLLAWGSGLRGRDPQRSKTFLREAVRQVETIDDGWLKATAYLFLGEVNHLQGDYAAAAAQYTQGYVVAKQADCAWGLANGQRLLGRLQLAQEHYTVGEAHLHNSIAYARQQNLKVIWLEAMIHLGDAFRLQGRFDEAQHWYNEGRQEAEAIHHAYRIGQAIWGQGCLAEQRGEYAAAQALFAESMKTGHPNLWVHLLPTPGWALIGLGELVEAQRYFDKALTQAQTLHLPPISLDAQVGLAYIQTLRAQQGDSESQAWVKKNCHVLPDLYDHPAATAETRRRIAKITAAFDQRSIERFVPAPLGVFAND